MRLPFERIALTMLIGLTGCVAGADIGHPATPFSSHSVSQLNAFDSHKREQMADFSEPIRGIVAGEQDDPIFRDDFEDASLIRLLAPENGAAVNTPTLDLIGDLRSDVVELSLDGQPIAFFEQMFNLPIVLSEGANSFLLEAATSGEQTESLLVLLTLDTIAPPALSIEFIAVSEPDDGQVLVEGFALSSEGNSTITIDNLDGPGNAQASADSQGRFAASLAAVAGDELELVAIDTAGNLSPAVVVVVPQSNRAPILSSIGNHLVELGRTLNFAVNVSDPDGDDVFVAANPMPAGASFDTSTGQFSFRPAAGQTGDFVIEFAASDGELTATETITITVNVTSLGTTRLSGRVLDTTDFVSGTETPVVGIAATMVGTSAAAISAADGRFAINDIPPGATILDLDPATAQPAPDGSNYAGFREAVGIIPDVDNVIERPLLLPRIAESNQQLVDPNALSIIRNDEIGVRIEIPPHTAKGPDGSDYAGPMSISLVPDSQAPAALPDELGFGLLITIQPVGVYFDQPVPIFFPNADGWPEATEVDIWSLDANTGQFGIVGTARVQNNELVTVAGGVLTADWHGFLARQLLQILEEQTGCDVCERLRLVTGSETVVGTGALRQHHDLATYRALEQELGLSLVYNSQEASPQPFVRSQVRIPLLKPGRIVSRVAINGIEGNETWFDTAGLQTGDRIEVGALADVAMLPTGTYPFEFETDAVFQFSRVGTTGRGRLVVVNEANSPFGAGWTLDGLERVREQVDGALLWQRGGGTARDFRSLRAGTGRFAGARALIPGRDSGVDGVRHPVAADFNGNGRIDVAFPTSRFSFLNNNHIALRLNQGDGRFGESRIELLAAPSSLVATDFDADGDIDMVVCGIDFIDILINDGAANFSAPQRINSNNIDNCDQIVAADLNGDNLPELLYLDSSGPATRVSLLIAQGGLVWSPPVDLIGGDRPKSIAAGDLDGDGHIDIAVANFDSDNVTVFFSDGNANLTPVPAYAVGNRPNGIAIGDINGDSQPDLVVTLDNADAAIAVLLNDGSGQFGPPVFTAIGQAPRGIAVADLDGDGDIDIAVATSADSAISVLLNNGLGGFPQRQQYFTSSSPQTVVIADLDGDTRPDLMTHSGSSSNVVVSWLRARGDGSFVDARVIPKNNDSSGNGVGRDLIVADFDGDGIDDVAVGFDTGGVIDIHFGSGSGFRAPPRAVFAQTGNNGGMFDAADLNGNSVPDLVSAETISAPYHLITILNDGNGNFADGAEVLRMALPGRPLDLEVGDLNNDGRPDVLVTHQADPAFALTPYFSLGEGNYVQGTSVPMSDNLGLIRLGDLNGDGLLDAVVLARQNGSVLTVSTYLNTGDGNLVFAAVQPVETGFAGTVFPGDLALADLDGDGRLDVLATLDPSGSGPRYIKRLAGQGDGTLAGAVDEVAVCNQRDNSRGLRVEDIDADGDLDVLATCANSATVEIFVNNGVGALARNATIALGHRSSGGLLGPVGLADFNRDGAPDLVVSTNAGLQFASAEPAAEITGYRAPIGEFSTLVKTPDGSFTRTEVDGTVHQFNAAGLEVSRSDRNGNTFTFDYDGSARLTSVTDPVGNMTTLDYTGARLSSITGPAGRVTQFQHDGNGNLTAITDPDGSQRGFSYDARHRMRSHTDKRGGLTRYEYDANGFQTRVIRADASVNLFRPASAAIVSRPVDGVGTVINPLSPVLAGQLFSERVDGRGQTWRYRTNPRGAMEERIDPLGGVFRILRNGHGLPARQLDENGVESRFSYNRLGIETSRTEAVGLPEQRTERRLIDAFGLPTAIIDFNGNTTQLARDSSGNLTTLIDGLGNTIDLAYNTNGLITEVIDRNGNSSQLTYQADGNLLTRTNPDGIVTRFDRDGAGNVLAVTNADGHALARTSQFKYDPMNRVTMETDALGGVATTVYDPAGNPMQRQLPDRSVLVSEFDPRNRLISRSGSEPLLIQEYDGEGALVRVSDASGQIVEVLHDALGREIGRFSPQGVETVLQRDPVGKITRLSDGLGQRWEFEYDALRREIRRVEPGGFEREQSYDSLGQITQIVQQDSSVIEISHDALSQVVEIRTPDDTLLFDYDPTGNLVRARDSDSDTSFAYDAINRRIDSTTAAGESQPVVRLTSTWDALDRRTSRNDSLGGIEQFTYDAKDRLVSAEPTVGAAIELSYDGSDALTGITYPNGLEMTRNVDSAGRVAGIKLDASAVNLLQVDFGFDDRFVVESRSEDATMQLFVHDQLYRQTEATDPQPEFYTFDAAGNREASHLSAMHQIGPGNRLSQDDRFDYQYDELGRLVTRANRTSGLVRSYEYDTLSRLTSVTLEDASLIRYRYDAFGRRIEKNVNGTIIRYIYDGENIALEFDGNDSLLARYSYGPGRDFPLVQIRSGQSYYYHLSRLNHVLSLTDAAGLVVNEYRYDSFGNPVLELEMIDNPFRFTSREWDTETAQYFYRSRHYDPLSGRFTTPDPLGFLGGDPNLYRYVLGSPLNFTDPDGELIALLIALGAAAIVGSKAINAGSRERLRLAEQDALTTSIKNLERRERFGQATLDDIVLLDKLRSIRSRCIGVAALGAAENIVKNVPGSTANFPQTSAVDVGVATTTAPAFER